MGTVNLITKQPFNGWLEEGSVQAGSFGLQRYMIDFNRPLYDDSTTAFRINAAYQQDDGFRNFGFDQDSHGGPGADVGDGRRLRRSPGRASSSATAAATTPAWRPSTAS